MTKGSRSGSAMDSGKIGGEGGKWRAKGEIKRTSRVSSGLPSIILSLVEGSHVAETRTKDQVLEGILHLARSNDVLGSDIVLLLFVVLARDSGDSRVGGMSSSRDARLSKSSNDSSRVERTVKGDGRKKQARSAKGERERGERSVEKRGREGERKTHSEPLSAAYA